MKADFRKVFIRELIEHNDYMPVRDEEGNPGMDGPVSLFAKDSFGSTVFLEILDGDLLTVEEITARLQENGRILSGIPARSAYYFLEVFLFHQEPEPEKQEAIAACQFHKALEKRFLKCLGVNLSAGTTERYYQVPVSDFGISKIVNGILAGGIPEGIEALDLDEIVLRKEKENRIDFRVKTPIFTYALIAINIIVAGLIYLYSTSSGKSYSELLLVFGAKVNFSILTGEYWRLVTPVFLHANMVHLLINCYSLYAIGVSVEKIYGRPRFLAVYFIAGITGNILSFMLSSNPGVGASGAIFGLLGAMLYFGLERPALFKRSFGSGILITIFINLAYGFSNAGIDNFAHIGGLIGGFLASGAVAKAPGKRWYFNRYFYIALTIILAFSGLVYGFNNKQSRILIKANELENLDRAQDWGGAEAKAEEILGMDPGNKNVRVFALWSLISAEAMSQKYDEAVEHAKEMILVDPQNGHYRLGALYFDMQRFELSRQELLEAKAAGAAYEQIDQMLSDIEERLKQ